MKRSFQALGGTLLGLLLAEGLFYVVDGGAFPHVNMYVADATLGARLAPGASQRIAFAGNPATSLRVNAQGYRGADWGAPVDGEVVVLGDSQVFGLGVEEDETASARLAATLGRPVRNAGVPTYGPPEYLAVLDELLAARKPTTVVLVVNFANDLFEIDTPNAERHAVWDGWAVRRETAPAEVTAFPGRRWLMSRSHLVLAARRAWWTPPEAWERGVASEGTWMRIAGLTGVPAGASAAATPVAGGKAAVGGPVAQGTRDEPVAAAGSAQEAVARRVRVDDRLIILHQDVFAEEWTSDLEHAVEGARRHAHPGDIVENRYAEAARPVALTAEQLRLGARVLRGLDARLADWAAAHPRDPRAADIRAALADKGDADATLRAFATDVPGEPGARSPLAGVVATARARCEAAGAELLVVALPLDVQVSEAEWAKYGVPPTDMTGTRALLTDLVADAEAMGVRALDATDALAAAEPGAFLHGDLHMTAKGQAALAAAIAEKLATPAPLRRPGAGLTAGRTRVPTWDELSLATEVVVRGSTRNHCSTRQLREWLLVECTSSPDGATVPQDVRVLQGEEALTGGEPGTSALLVTPLVPGRGVTAEFRWVDRVERLTVTWEGASPTMAFERAAPDWAAGPRTYACVDALSRGRRVTWFGRFDRGCAASFPTDCEAQRACATGTRDPLPTCPTGQANAGSAGHCHDLCDTTRPCARGTCVEWVGAGVCL